MTEKWRNRDKIHIPTGKVTLACVRMDLINKCPKCPRLSDCITLTEKEKNILIENNNK